jgi:hypothetical protein
MITLPPFLAVTHASGWTPASDPGLYVWHAADRQGGTNGVAVSQLTDFSGNGRHATTGASKPLYRTSGVKGLPSFDFIGSRFASTSITPFTDTQIAWFMAIKASSGTAAFGRFVACAGPGIDFNTAQTCIPAYLHFNATITLSAGRFNVLPTYEAGVANGAERVLSSVFGPSRFDLWTDGVAAGGGVVGAAFNFNTLHFGKGSGSEFCNSMIAEVFALTGTLTTSRRLQSEGYLRAKYR